jgi:cation transport ATPase
MFNEKKEPSLKDKLKEGISVQDLETFARRYTHELFLILAIIIASISSMFHFFMSPSWAISFAALATVVSIGFPEQMSRFQKPIFSFLYKQEKSMLMIIGIVRLIVALFLPFVIFTEIGMLAGMAFHHLQKCFSKGNCSHFISEEPSSDEKEHL